MMTSANPGASAVSVGGPHFDELSVGDRLDGAPSVTISAGLAALHQAIVGDRLRLPLDRQLSERVLRAPQTLAHPALVCDIAIGQSTQLTQRVIANLFYRGLAFARAPVVGDTLTTSTEVVALRQNQPRSGRASTGLAALRITTVDQLGRPVLDFWRCAMLPLRDPGATTSHWDDLAVIPEDLDTAALGGVVHGWDLDAFRGATPGRHPDGLTDGSRWIIEGGDVVSLAPELARLSLNIATAHHDHSRSGRRLVYGGHTIGLAAAQATRALPDLVTILAWHGCDHIGPVYEGDTLASELKLERTESLIAGGALVHLRSRVHARRQDEDVPVLDWRFVGVMA